MAEYRVRRRIAWGECDAAGIVFYPNYFRWFDEATHDLFRSIGFSMETLLEEGRALPIIDAGAKFHVPLTYSDEIDVESRISEVRSRSFRVEHMVRREAEVAARGYEIRMYIGLTGDRGVLTPGPLPERLRYALSAATR